MLFKVLGSILVISAGFGAAYSIRRDLAAHLRLLYDLRKLILDISYAASGSMQPVEILLGCFIRSGDERLNKICGGIAERLMEKRETRGEEVWRRTFAKYRAELGLDPEEAEVAEGMGQAFFGRSVEENRKHLELSLERLDFLIERVRGEQREKQKIYGMVSVLGGVMLVILLV